MRLLCPLIVAAITSTAFAATAPTQSDVAYGPDPDQRYDIYRPANADNVPLVLMVHGGGWFRGDKEMGRVVDNKVERWVPRGIAFVTMNYRMQPKAPPLQQARDVARALADVQQHGQKLGIDQSNIVLMGHSAGAHLIALLAARPELLAEAGAKPPQGFVLLDSGALDVPAIMNARHFRLYDRAFGSNPADWAAASPYQQLHQATAPILAVCSSRRDNACPQSQAFVAKARGLGTQAEVLPLDKSHGEINAQLGEDPGYTASVERFLGRLSPKFAERLP
jgi:acetyl esterase/lipase